MMTNLRRELPALLNEASRLLDSSTLRRGVVCETICRVHALVAALSAWSHYTAGVLKSVAVCCSVLQCVAVCCSVLQCVAVCCSVLQCVHFLLGPAILRVSGVL